MPRLLEQPGRARLGLADLLRGLRLRFLEGLARLGLGRVQHLCPLALTLVAVALDLGLALLQLVLAPRDLLLGSSELCGRCVLRVALDRVGHLSGCADQVQRIHAHCVTGRLDPALPGGLEHAQLDLELRRVAPERLERVANLVAVIAVGRSAEILDARQRRQRRCL